jgi:hypothetical protein
MIPIIYNQGGNMSERPQHDLGRIAASLEMIETYLGMVCKGTITVDKKQVGEVSQTKAAVVPADQKLNPKDKPRSRKADKKTDESPVVTTDAGFPAFTTPAEDLINMAKPDEPATLTFDMLKQGGLRYQRLFGKEELIALIKSYKPATKISQIPVKDHSEFWNVCWQSLETGAATPAEELAENFME